ncbi:MAG TPA: ABC transporter permease subunit [Streptosporangiaceae bacterium]|nr:ABC transporter permease subunit [Streptosporangiaceae bacterium]
MRYRLFSQVGFAVAAALPFVFLAALTLYPLLQQLFGSFYIWYQLKPSTFTGVTNYMRLFGDPVARAAALRTLGYVLVTVPCEVGLGLAAASLTLRARRGQALLLALFILPLVVPWPAAAQLFEQAPGWSHLYDNSVFLSMLLIVIGIWKGTPWCFLLLLGALSISPAEVFEAARIDGAHGMAYLRRILLPAVRPMLIFVVVLRILAEAQNLTSVTLLTGGGPSFSTQVSAYYGYEMAFSYFQFGEAAALATLLGAALIVVALAGWRLAWPRKAAAPASAGAPSTHALRALEPPHKANQRPPVPPQAGTGRGSRRPKQRGLTHSMAWASRGRWSVLVFMLALVLIPFAGGARGLASSQGTGGSGGPGGRPRPPGLNFGVFDVQWRLIDTGLRNSAIVTAGTLIATLLLAIPAAYLLARTKFRLNGALFVFVLFTLAIPGVVIILPEVEEMARLHLVNTHLGLICLYTAANLPLAAFFLRPAFASVPEPLVEGMRVDGASGLVIMRRLFLPFTARTMVGVALLVVVFVWNELPLAVVMINSQSLQTLPVLIALGIGGSGSLQSSWISMAPPLLLFLMTLPYFRRGLITGSLL